MEDRIKNMLNELSKGEVPKLSPLDHLNILFYLDKQKTKNKKVKDLVNWARSEASIISNRKLTTVIDNSYKSKFLKKIIDIEEP